jgi:acyl-CoA thioesterase-1
VATALTDELPGALSVQPTLVTVWLNVNDLTGGVSAQRYEADLDHLVSALRRGGLARVLLANTPYLDRLPAYLDCRSGLPLPQGDCPPTLAVTAPSELNNKVDTYNSAIARVAQHEGAVVVDLHAVGEVPDAHPDWVSGDGFHPSTNGYNAIAAEFATALKQTDK